MSEPTSMPPDGEFLKLFLVGLDKRALRMDERLEAIEDSQKEILRLQIGQTRDLSAHLATPHAPMPAAPAANGDTDAKVERALQRLVFKWIWENKKAAALALAFFGAGSGGTIAFKGCGGKEIHVHDAASLAAPTMTAQPIARGPAPRARADYSPD